VAVGKKFAEIRSLKHLESTRSAVIRWQLLKSALSLTACEDAKMRELKLILLLGLLSQLLSSCNSPSSTNAAKIIKNGNSNYVKVAPSSTTPSGGGIYKLEDAGIQFEAPTGWKVERAEGEPLIVSTSDNSLALTFESIDADKIEQTTQHYKDRINQNLSSVTTVDGPEQRDLNGLPLTSESGIGKKDDNTNEWSIDIVRAKKAVIIYSLTSLDVFEQYQSGYESLVNSIKKN
ncbi:MAG TPA: hypothetical protein VGO69_06405, partial [Pyrinomonadaceae bacterium]|nr:hypothetical protein [Pyrinomonadaceae bacterium]